MKIAAPEGPIAPNAKGKIGVSIMTTNLRGPYRKDIEVVTNDPHRDNIILSVQAKIVEVLAIMPSYVNFGVVELGENAVKEIIITNNGTQPITLKKISVSPAGLLSINPQKKQVLQPGEKKMLLLTLTSGKTTGMVEGTVLIKTNLPSLAEKSIYVRAEIMGPPS